jgi:PST family polysaccharide transporter
VDHAAVRGSVWLIVTGLVTRVIGMVGTLVLTHLMLPASYGEVSAAVVVSQTANIIANVGVGIYVIAHPQAGQKELFHAAVLHIGLGLVLFLPALAMSDSLSTLVPSLHHYLPGLLVMVMFERINLLPERLLVRQMRFGVLSLQRAGGELVFTAVLLATAAAGMDGTSVVIANLARSGGRLPVLLALAGWRQWLTPCRLQKEIFARILRFGLPISAGQILLFGQRRWDNLVVMWLHGAAALGAYNLAYNLADLPAVQVGEQITDALQASIANSPAEDQRLQLLRWLSMLAIVMTPMAVGLGAVAPTVTELFINESWAAVAPMLMWLSIISFPRPLSGMVTAYLQVRHQKRAFLALELFTVLALLGSLLTLGRLGPVEACMAVGAAFFMRLGAAAVLLRKIDGLPLGQFFRPQIAPIVAAAAMAAVVTVVRLALEQAGTPGGVRLAAEVIVGVPTYVLALRLLARSAWRDFIALLRQSFGRRFGGDGALSATSAVEVPPATP